MKIKETYQRHLVERKVEEATKWAYATMRENQMRAERENFYFDGFAEKDAIINGVMTGYRLDKHSAEDAYFNAVYLMTHPQVTNSRPTQPQLHLRPLLVSGMIILIAVVVAIIYAVAHGV